MKYPVNKNLFNLNDDIIYLNHASFGATPKIVLDEFFNLTLRMESNPMQFFIDDYHKLMENAKEKISSKFNIPLNNIAFLENATTGVNAVLRSLLPEIDNSWEILTFDHYYPAVSNTLKYISNITKCNIKVIELPEFVESQEQIIELLQKNINSKTKLLVIDHISSISAISYPIKQIITLFHNYNIPVLVDGAHAPGYIDLNILDINPDWYTANLHKWFFAPKGTAILYTSDNWLNKTHPVTISNDFGKGYNAEFDWTGTKNICSWLSAPKFLDFYDEFFNYEYCKNLADESRQLILKETKLQPMINTNLSGLMHSYYLPDKFEPNISDLKKLRLKLLKNYKIEIFINPFKSKLILRTSSQIYNHIDEYKILSKAINEIS